jgi:hypothetical protein
VEIMSDWREIMGVHAAKGLVKRTHNPQDLPIAVSSADIAHNNQTSGSEAPRPARAVIEATFKPTVETATTPSSGPTFPPCPGCGGVRYWISHAKVMCGSRACYGAIRFQLLKIEFHPVN